VLRTFTQALVLGLSVAAPVGPIGILCIRRTLTDGRRVGLACGLGAASADALFAAIASLGVTATLATAGRGAVALRVVSALYLGVLGVRTFVARPPIHAPPGKQSGQSWRAWTSTFALTLGNPTTILSFAALFPSVTTLGQSTAAATAFSLVTGVFLGSAVWWFTLSLLVSRFRNRVDAHRLAWINRVAGAVLVGFAFWALATIA
jgi:threonine/homoserine/homoserine lactone efflux protein